MGKRILVTGVAGFIGYFTAKKLLEEGHFVFGIDNLNDYYDVKLKDTRLELLNKYKNFYFEKIDISKKERLYNFFEQNKLEYVIHLAAQAGVRYSITNPDVYIDSNLIGFFNILESCRKFPVKHLVYASSSSVYGANNKVPFEESDRVDSPVSLYAATKKSNELMAHTYSHLFNIKTTGLRFFTVYGPLGRPDMAYFSFVDKYLSGESIKIFNNGDFANDMYRDFTYVDDIVEGVLRVTFTIDDNIKYKILNIGNNNPVKLMTFISTLEKCLSKSIGREVVFNKEFEPIKMGDVWKTYASTRELEKIIEFKPDTPLEKGLQEFTDWYCSYYKIK